MIKTRDVHQGGTRPRVAEADLKPLLDRIEKLEALVKQQQQQLQQQPARPTSVEARPEDVEKALQKLMPQILDRIADTIGARLPEVVDRAAEKLSTRVAEQFAARLAESGFDAREIVSSIAWSVVPDVAEMLVRRELEEIRRHI